MAERVPGEMDGQPSAGRGRRYVFLAALFCVLLLPRMIYLYRVAPEVREAPHWDGRGYAAMALNVLDGKGLSPEPDGQGEMNRTPGYPLFVASALFYLPVDRWEYIYMVHASLLAAADVLMFGMIASVFSPVVGLLVVIWHAACGPLRIEMPHVMTENLYAPLLVACCYLFLKTIRRARWSHLLCLGALLGYSVLVRPPAIAHVIGFSIGLVLCLKQEPRRLLKVGVVILMAVLIVLPWVVRNKIRCGSFHLTSQVGMLGTGMEQGEAGLRSAEEINYAGTLGLSGKLKSVAKRPWDFAKLSFGHFGTIWGQPDWRRGLLLALVMLGAAALMLWRRHPWGTYLLVAFGATLLMSLFWGIARYSFPYIWIVVSTVAGFGWLGLRRCFARVRKLDEAANEVFQLPSAPAWVWGVGAALFLTAVTVFGGVLIARNYLIDSMPSLTAGAFTEEEARELAEIQGGADILTPRAVRDLPDKESGAIGAPIIVSGRVRFVERLRRYHSSADELREFKQTGTILGARSRPGFGHVFEVASNSHLKPHSRGDERVFCTWPFETLPGYIRDGAVVSLIGVVEEPDLWKHLRVRCVAARRLAAQE